MRIIYQLKALPALIKKLEKAEAAACRMDNEVCRLRQKVEHVVRNSYGDISLSFDYDELKEYL